MVIIRFVMDKRWICWINREIYLDYIISLIFEKNFVSGLLIDNKYWGKNISLE